MSARHPIVAVTGSSGAGTSSARPLLERLFAELGLRAAYVEGDSFHAYDRAQMQAVMDRARIRAENFSHFGPAANLFDRLEQLFEEFGERGTGTVRRYLHTDAEAREARQPVGSFTPWQRLPTGIDLLFYEGLHGGVVTPEHDVAAHVDLLIGMTPTINLEWVQKMHRDTAERGHAPEEVTRSILRRMPDYVNYIVPQFARTDVNFQRVPLVDTSQPFALRDVPKDVESLVVVHLRPGGRIAADLQQLCAALPGATTSRADTLVVPGAQMGAAMEAVLRPALAALKARRAAPAAAVAS